MHYTLHSDNLQFSYPASILTSSTVTHCSVHRARDQVLYCIELIILFLCKNYIILYIFVVNFSHEDQKFE